jgi:hypothetical protein
MAPGEEYTTPGDEYIEESWLTDNEYWRVISDNYTRTIDPLALCSGDSNFQFKELHESKIKLLKVLEYELGAQMGTLDGKNRK